MSPRLTTAAAFVTSLLSASTISACRRPDLPSPRDAEAPLDASPDGASTRAGCTDCAEASSSLVSIPASASAADVPSLADAASADARSPTLASVLIAKGKREGDPLLRTALWCDNGRRIEKLFTKNFRLENLPAISTDGQRLVFLHHDEALTGFVHAVSVDFLDRADGARTRLLLWSRAEADDAWSGVTGAACTALASTLQKRFAAVSAQLEAHDWRPLGPLPARFRLRERESLPGSALSTLAHLTLERTDGAGALLDLDPETWIAPRVPKGDCTLAGVHPAAHFDEPSSLLVVSFQTACHSDSLRDGEDLHLLVDAASARRAATSASAPSSPPIAPAPLTP
jgi:hypothetical protein